MGYTHYWNYSKETTDTKWKDFIAECRKLIANAPEKTDTAGGYCKNDRLELAGGDGTGKPIVNNKAVNFNGRGELSHESFFIYKNDEDGFNFCKTARKPYDLIVVACLIAGVKHLKLKISSDGRTSDGRIEDLKPAIKYYNEVIKPDVDVTDQYLLNNWRN